LLRRVGKSFDSESVLAEFAAQESAQQAATPEMPYAELLSLVYSRLAAVWGVIADPADAARFGTSVGDWPAFPDTVAALQRLHQRYRLVILSNVDRHSFQATQKQLGVPFNAIYTAQDIGSYKPDPRNFAFLIERLQADGFQKSEILHVAQSLFHDHAPANAVGLASAWIDRRRGAAGWGATVPPPPGVRYDFRFESLTDLAQSVA
jgi:2-haloalkanoic acid dehalogenase type II